MTHEGVADLQDISGYILAGGRSSRMGSDKGCLLLNGEPLVSRVASMVSSVARSVTVVGHPSLHEASGLQVIQDRPDSGANHDYVRGIVTALEHSQSTWTLVLPVDMPYITSQFLKHLASRGIDSDVDLTVYSLCMFFRTSCLPKVRRGLSANPWAKVGKNMFDLTYEVLNEEEIRPFDSTGWLKHDVDTPEEFALAQLRLADLDDGANTGNQ